MFDAFDRIKLGLLALSLFGGLATAAEAGSITCPPSATVTVTLTTGTTSSCYLFGNGNHLTGVSATDVVIQAGYTLLDVNSPTVPNTAGIDDGALSISGGSFSFIALAGYTNYVLGIQTSSFPPTPDYFSFMLPAGVTSGTYAINFSGSGAGLERGVLYAQPVPGPVVGAGLPGAILAFGGLLGWMRRRKAALAA
jgi:hypothetical protein